MTSMKILNAMLRLLILISLLHCTQSKTIFNARSVMGVMGEMKYSASNQIMFLLQNYARDFCPQRYVAPDSPSIGLLIDAINNMTAVGNAVPTSVQRSIVDNNNDKIIETLTGMQCAIDKSITVIQKLQAEDTVPDAQRETCNHFEQLMRHVESGRRRLDDVAAAETLRNTDYECIQRQLDIYLEDLATVKEYFASLDMSEFSYREAKREMAVMMVQFADVAHDIEMLLRASQCLTIEAAAVAAVPAVEPAPVDEVASDDEEEKGDEEEEVAVSIGIDEDDDDYSDDDDDDYSDDYDEDYDSEEDDYGDYDSDEDDYDDYSMADEDEDEGVVVETHDANRVVNTKR